MRVSRLLLWIVGLVLGVPLALVGLVLIALNTGPGQALVAGQAGALTGGMVRLEGLHGWFPQALRLDRVAVADAHGVWVSAEGVALDWSPLALLGGTARIDRLSVRRLIVTRKPVPAAAPAKPAPATNQTLSLPVDVQVGALAIERAEIGAPVAGVAAVVAVQGSAAVPGALDRGTVDVTVRRLDAAGAYHVAGGLAADGAASATVALDEPAGGLIGQAARLPALGALAVHGTVSGPRTAERVALSAAAGPLRLALNGTADLKGRTADMALEAQAPAMRPAPTIAWTSIDVRARARGPWTAPDATAHVALAGLEAGGAALAALNADLTGNRRQADLHAAATGLRLPGPKPDLFATPVDLTAHADLVDATRPVDFRLSHALLALAGRATVGGAPTVHAHLTVPELAAAGGADLHGPADVVLDAAVHGPATDARFAGTIDLRAGQAPLPALLGPTRIAGDVTLAGAAATVRSLTVDGRALHLDVAGRKDTALDFTANVWLADLAVLSPQAQGNLAVRAHVSGPAQDLAATADITGEVGTARVPKGPITLALRAAHLPAAPTAHVEAHGRPLGAALTLLADASRDAAGTLRAHLAALDWRSVSARADLTQAKGSTIPVGRIAARVGNLADLADVTGQKLAGALSATIDTPRVDAPTAIEVTGTGLGAAGSRVARLAIRGTVAGADRDPDLDVTLAADGVESGGITGTARASARGRAAALALGAQASLHNVAGADLTASTAGVLDAKVKVLRLTQLAADTRGLALRLRAPARIGFGTATTVDRLALALNTATIDVAGRFAPTLDATARVRNVTPELARPFAPTLSASGVLSADARLTGQPAAPAGTLRLTATGLRLRQGPAASLPAAAILATVGLDGRTARVDVRADAGPKLHLAVTGTAPLAPQGALALRSTGAFDLALLDPVLQADGRAAKGRLALDLAVGGTGARPAVSGSATLAGGEIQDYVQGLHLTAMSASVVAEGQTVRLARFTAQAGPGTLAASGTFGIAAPQQVDLHLTAANAQPLASDLLTASLDADLMVRGAVQGTLDAGGTVKIRRAEINIPDSLPPSVAVLPVRRPGDKPPPVRRGPPAAAPPPAVVRLAIDVDAPRAIFVRGHGLDAELGGTLHVRGTADRPDIAGGFDMRRGEFSLAGTTLEFSKGSVGFNGAGVTGKIDPTLDFEADSYQGGITATLKITGYADMPKIGLSSVPDLPQDEVLAHLLFGTSMKNLTPLQIAEIGAALAEISGLTGGGGGPLASIRKGLGLDRLNVGGGTNGAGASVEAGRYVAPGVYVGAKQATSGAGGTQAQVQIDLTRHLKLQTTLGTGGGTAQGATPENDPGSSVGLAYQFEY